MKSYKEIRLMNYKHRRDEEDEFYVDIDNWFKSPYSSLKARYYIEVSSIITSLCKKLNLKFKLFFETINTFLFRFTK